MRQLTCEALRSVAGIVGAAYETERREAAVQGRTPRRQLHNAAGNLAELGDGPTLNVRDLLRLTPG